MLNQIFNRDGQLSGLVWQVIVVDTEYIGPCGVIMFLYYPWPPLLTTVQQNNDKSSTKNPLH